MSEFLHVVYTFSVSNVDESGQVRIYINGNLADQKLKQGNVISSIWIGALQSNIDAPDFENKTLPPSLRDT